MYRDNTLIPSEAIRLLALGVLATGERQLARLTELRGHHGDTPGHLPSWLDHEIDQTRERLGWFRDLQVD